MHDDQDGSQGAAAQPREQGGGTSPESAAKSDGLYKLLVESVRDYAIFALDPTGHVLSWNPGAQRFKGYQANEIIGRHFSVFYPEEDKWKPPYELEVAEAEGRFEDEGWRVRKDGTRFWANVVITALRDSSGTLVGFAKVTRDLTERRASELREIDNARRLALSEASDRAKANFLAAMSHELRTPLNAIGGYAELLLTGVAGELTPLQQDYLERMQRSQKHLLSIITDILTFSQAGANKLEYDIEPFVLAEALHDTLSLLEIQAAAKRISLTWRRGEELVVLADRRKVDQIMVNLVSNAVKFTGQGGRIEVGTARQGNCARVMVKDSGIGIPAAELSSIFQPFVQVGRSHTSGHEGTGLGLAISRDMAHAMNGGIEVESELGKGSTFTLLLPLAKTER